MREQRQQFRTWQKKMRRTKSIKRCATINTARVAGIKNIRLRHQSETIATQKHSNPGTQTVYCFHYANLKLMAHVRACEQNVLCNQAKGHGRNWMIVKTDLRHTKKGDV
ncbi:hypothetical protein TRVL_07176 [Trypanosoma vivax]|nr:hypothetical protein TRVL_07176 [Trypanosoma vivax]